MLYQLVLITNLGVVTPLATFDNSNECFKARAMISNTSQYSTACLPTESPEQLQKKFEGQAKMMMQTFGVMVNEMNKVGK